MSIRLVAVDVDPEEGVMLCSDFILLRRYIGLPHFFLSFSFPHTEAHVQYDLALSQGSFLYDINLGATHTTMLSTRGVTIPIYLVSSTMDSIWQCVVLFKAVPIPTSDLKSEFLCQLSISCEEPADSP